MALHWYSIMSSAIDYSYPTDSDGKAVAGAAAPPSSGLVSLETSKTQKPLRVTTRGNRLSKMRRIVIAASKIIQEQLQSSGFRYRAAMITLTYRPDAEWEARQISKLIDCYRKWGKRRSVEIKGVWVLEMTKAGRPHYHLILFLPRGVTPPLPDKQGWWKEGMTNAKWAYRPVGYIAKYASKGTDLPMPKGARVYGVYGVSRQQLSYWRAPNWLRDCSTPGDEIKRDGEWWCNKSTGFSYRSPWVLDGFGPEGVVLLWVGWDTEDIIFA